MTRLSGIAHGIAEPELGSVAFLAQINVLRI